MLQNAPPVKNWAGSCVQASERDLQVAYLMINICAFMSPTVPPSEQEVDRV